MHKRSVLHLRNAKEHAAATAVRSDVMRIPKTGINIKLAASDPTHPPIKLAEYNHVIIFCGPLTLLKLAKAKIADTKAPSRISINEVGNRLISNSNLIP